MAFDYSAASSSDGAGVKICGTVFTDSDSLSKLIPASLLVNSTGTTPTTADEVGPDNGLYVQKMDESVSRKIATASTNLTTAKGAAGIITGWHLANLTSGKLFVKVYNSTSASVGSTTPKLTLMIPANSVVSADNLKLECDTGIQYAITALVADSDATAVTAEDVVVNLFYV